MELSFSDPWSCSKNPTVYANYGKNNQSVIAENAPSDGTAVTGIVTVNDGKLTVNMRSDDKAINVNYIIIRTLEKAPLETVEHDVNMDGKFSIADIVLFQNWLLGRTNKLADPAAADCDNDSILNSFDLCLMRKAYLEYIN